uniref:Uncharacterized protein n=1 Tax=Aegilops tauschii subsp. strangulata TaxID=200361 RepID=A0A453PUG0_AEGTS
VFNVFGTPFAMCISNTVFCCEPWKCITTKQMVDDHIVTILLELHLQCVLVILCCEPWKCITTEQMVHGHVVTILLEKCSSLLGYS